MTGLATMTATGNETVTATAVRSVSAVGTVIESEARMLLVIKVVTKARSEVEIHQGRHPACRTRT